MGCTAVVARLAVLLLLAAAPRCLASRVDPEQADKPQPAVPPPTAAVPESASHFLLGGQPLLAPAPHLLEGLLEGLVGPAAASVQAAPAAAQAVVKPSSRQPAITPVRPTPAAAAVAAAYKAPAAPSPPPARPARPLGATPAVRPARLTQPTAAVIKPAPADLPAARLLTAQPPAAPPVRPQAAEPTAAPAARLPPPAIKVQAVDKSAGRTYAPAVKAEPKLTPRAAPVAAAGVVAPRRAAAAAPAAHVAPAAARLPFMHPIEGLASSALSVVDSLLGMLGVHITPAQPAAAPAAAAVPKPASAPVAAAVPKPSVMQQTAAAVPKPVAQLPQVPKGYAAMCEWRPDLGSCWVGRSYLLSVSGKPMSFASKLVSAAAARDNACAAFNNPIACTEQSTGPLLCSWGISSGANAFERGCRSMYLAEWDAFAAQVQRGSNAAVAAQAMGHAGLFMCPGSVGQKSLGCSSIYPMDKQGRYIAGICQQGTGCAYQETHHACVASAPLTQLIRKVEPRIVGTCSAACYMRMLQQCSKATQQPAALRKAWCGKQQGCIWADNGSSCKPDVWLSKLDQWGQQVLAASEACGVWRSEAVCAAGGVKGAVKLQPARAAEFLKQNIGTGSPSTKCPV